MNRLHSVTTLRPTDFSHWEQTTLAAARHLEESAMQTESIPAIFMDSRFPVLMENAGLLRGANADFDGIARVVRQAEGLARGGPVTIEAIESALAIFPPHPRSVPSSFEPSRRFA